MTATPPTGTSPRQPPRSFGNPFDSLWKPLTAAPPQPHDGDPFDDSLTGHGTIIASIVAGDGNNGVGIASLAGQDVRRCLVSDLKAHKGTVTKRLLAHDANAVIDDWYSTQTPEELTKLEPELMRECRCRKESICENGALLWHLHRIYRLDVLRRAGNASSMCGFVP